MLLDTTRPIEHQIGDIIGLQIYHVEPGSIEVFETDGKMTGFGVKSDFKLTFSPVLFEIKILTVDEKKKFESGVLIGCGMVRDRKPDGTLDIDFTPDPNPSEPDPIGGKYIGLTTMARENGVEQYEAYVIPMVNGDQKGPKIIKVGCLGKCERS